MALRGVKPEAVEKRLKMLVYGPPGVGKTTAAIQFPNAYLIDMERGAENYADTIKKAHSVIFATTNPDEIRSEIKSLLTEKHDYKTLILDPVTILYAGVQEKWGKIFEKHATSEKQAELGDFGMRYWGRVKADYKSIQRLLLTLDMNVIITSHQKDIYGLGMQKIGVGPDSMKGDEYFFDYVFQLERQGDRRMARTIKERAEMGKSKFPETFEWSYDNFKKFYGTEIIQKESTPVELATDDQVKEMEQLLELVKIPDATIALWFQKADCSEWGEMSQDQIKKCINHVKKMLEPVGGK